MQVVHSIFNEPVKLVTKKTDRKKEVVALMIKWTLEMNAKIRERKAKQS